jgi:hypothetical protein
MLGKAAAGAGLVLLIPVLFIAAAVGSIARGGAPVAGGVLCVPETGAPEAPTATYAATQSPEAGPRPCQAGELEAMVLSNPRITFTSEAAGDLAEGRVDPRVLQVLLFLGERHELGSVGPLITGHSYYVAGTTTPSNHAFGRAVDISVIDGQPVSVYNQAARDAWRWS